MPTKTNEPDSEALLRAFDAPADDWHGAGYRHSTTRTICGSVH
jgi:hypothetical protein